MVESKNKTWLFTTFQILRSFIKQCCVSILEVLICKSCLIKKLQITLTKKKNITKGNTK